MLAGAGKMVSQRQQSGKVPQLYSDYRKMLTENKLDIVLIGTPDHWHALQAIESLRSGAHVYVQKPISVDVIEGEAMVAARSEEHTYELQSLMRISSADFCLKIKNRKL